VITLDRGYPNETAARVRVEELLGGRVHRLTVRKLDLVNDTTTVDVRYEVDPDHSADGYSRAEREVRA
jgi:hypothetical protein